MKICICNDLCENDLKGMTLEEFLEIQSCGICIHEARILLTDSKEYDNVTSRENQENPFGVSISKTED